MPRLRLGKPQALIHLFVHLFVYFSMFYSRIYLFLFRRATVHAHAQKHARMHVHKPASTTQRPQQTTVSSKLVWWSRFSLSPNDHTAAH